MLEARQLIKKRVLVVEAKNSNSVAVALTEALLVTSSYNKELYDKTMWSHGVIGIQQVTWAPTVVTVLTLLVAHCLMTYQPSIRLRVSKILLFLNITTCKTKHPTHEPTGALTDQIQTIKTLLTEWMESLQSWLITPLNSSLFLERSHVGRSESWTWTVVNHLHQRPSQLWAWCLRTLTNSTHCFCVA